MGAFDGMENDVGIGITLPEHLALDRREPNMDRAGRCSRTSRYRSRTRMA